MSKWSEARDAQMVAEGWVKRPDGYWEHTKQDSRSARWPNAVHSPTEIKPPKRQSTKSLMNKTEARYFDRLVQRGCAGVMAQAITLRLDPPYRSYRPDFFRIGENGGWVFTEVKGPHRFREKGIAKAALAAKTYPQFTFELAQWTGSEWKETLL